MPTCTKLMWSACKWGRLCIPHTAFPQEAQLGRAELQIGGGRAAEAPVIEENHLPIMQQGWGIKGSVVYVWRWTNREGEEGSVFLNQLISGPSFFLI